MSLDPRYKHCLLFTDVGHAVKDTPAAHTGSVQVYILSTAMSGRLNGAD